MSDWKIGPSRELLHTFIWDVLETEKEMPNGKKGRFVSLKAPNWCTAVVRNAETNKFIMVREFRHGVNKWVYEFPCGTLEENETPESAVLREVSEETGYRHGRIVQKLFTGNPNAAFMSNRMNGYFVEVHGAREAQHLDSTEFLDVVEVSNPEDYFDDETSITCQLAWAKHVSFSREK